MLHPSRPRARARAGGTSFWTSSEPVGNGSVLALFGELDVASAPELERLLKRLLWAGASPITVDLSGLDFIDASGLHVLLRANRLACGGQLRLLRGPRRVQRVFELTDCDELLSFAD